MAKQNVGPYEIDLLTNSELKDALGHAIDPVLRMFRGEKIMRSFIEPVNATAAAFTLRTIPPSARCGPTSSYMWRVHYAMVWSNVITDTAKFVLYNGSDTTDLSGIHLHNAFSVTPAVTQPAPASPAIGASPYTYVNYNAYGVNATVSGGTVSSITVNGQPTGLTSGTFYLAPGSYITITYTVAPSFTVTNASSNTAASEGQNVNVAYLPGTKTWWVYNDEEVYATISGATPGNQYGLVLVAAQVPQEMQGKLV
jgi:hypothetical protein